jgi:hypothetical protein
MPNRGPNRDSFESGAVNWKARKRGALGARNHFDDLDVLVEHACFTLYDLASEETIGYDRRTDGHSARPGRAPMLGQRAQPLVIGDQVTMKQELTEPDGL